MHNCWIIFYRKKRGRKMETLKEMKYERIDFAEAKKKLEELTNHLKNASDAEEAFAIHQK